MTSNDAPSPQAPRPADEAQAIEHAPAAAPEVPPSAPLPASGTPRRGHLVILALIVLGALGLRVYELDRRSIWMDEIWAMCVSAGHELESVQPLDVVIDPPPAPPSSLREAVPWWEVWYKSKATTHPPLYYVVLRLWREAMGESQAVARALSVVFSMASLLLLWDLARRTLGPTAALWSAALMAVAVPQVVQAQEVRNYAFQLVLALLAAWSLVRIERDGLSPMRLALLVVALLAGMLNHYFSLGVYTGLLIWTLLTLRGRTLGWTVGAFVASGLLFLLAWGTDFREQMQIFRVGPETNDWLYDARPGRAWRALGQAMLVPAELIAPIDERTRLAAYLGAALYVLPPFLWKRRPELRLPWIWLVGSVGLLLALDIARSTLHLTHLRYSFVASPAVYMLLCGIVAPMRWVRHLLPAAAALSCALPLRTHYTEPYVDWRWPIDDLRAWTEPGDVLVFTSEGGPYYQVHLAFVSIGHYLGEFPGPVVLTQRNLPREVTDKLAARGRTTWLITGQGPTEPDRIVPGATVHERYPFHGTIDVWRLTWNDDGPTTGPSQAGPSSTD